MGSITLPWGMSPWVQQGSASPDWFICRRKWEGPRCEDFGPRWGPVTHRHPCARRQGSCDLSKVIESVCQPVKCPVIFPCRHNFIGIMECLGYRSARNSDTDTATGREILGIFKYAIKKSQVACFLKVICEINQILIWLKIVYSKGCKAVNIISPAEFKTSRQRRITSEVVLLRLLITYNTKISGIVGLRL